MYGSPRNKRIPRISCAQEVFCSRNADSGFYMAANPRNAAFPGLAATVPHDTEVPPTANANAQDELLHWHWADQLGIRKRRRR